MVLNEVFIFPFEKVKKGTDIILYGIGNVGKCFYNQIATTQYCNIVAIADKAADKIGISKFPMITPEQIINFSYDYIIIAIADTRAASQITDELVSFGILKTKIIYEPNRKSYIHMSNTNLSQWLLSDEVIKEELNRFWARRAGSTNYFLNIINSIHELQANHQEERIKEIKNILINYLYKEKSIKNKIVILRILYESDCFTAELLKLYASCISQINNLDSRMWSIYDISVIEGNNPNCRYCEYYIEKRELVKRTAYSYYDLNDYNMRGKDGNRVAIIAFTLGNRKSSHNALVVPYANEMIEQGKEVAVFPIDLFRYRYGECFIQPIVPLEQNAKTYEDWHKEIFDSRVKIVYTYGETIKERIHNLIDGMITYNPYVVYDCCGEYSYLSPLINKLFFTVALPIRGYASSACFDIYVSRNKQLCINENKIYHSINEEQMEEALVCSKPLNISGSYQRKEYLIDEDAFVITTVGDRLQKELTPKFIDCVCDFLETHEKTCWILVGGKINNYIKICYSKLIAERKIIEWGYELDLLSFYAICDIYWNPDRMGSGGSIVTAMRRGLPIVTTTFPSDVLPRIGVENAINGDYDECKKYVEKLYADKDFYREKSKLMQDRTNISSVKEYVKKLLDIGERYKYYAKGKK